MEQVEVAVITKTVMVTHQPGQISKPALVAALNSAGLDAYAQAPRQQAQTRGSWIPPWHGKELVYEDAHASWKFSCFASGIL